MTLKHAFSILVLLALTAAFVSHRSPTPQPKPSAPRVEIVVEPKAVAKRIKIESTSEPVTVQTVAKDTNPPDVNSSIPKQTPPAQPAQVETPKVAAHDPKAAPKAIVKLDQKPEVAVNIPRIALSLVGMDSYAEAIWTDAINNPNLSEHERRDLIEDLNEDGFPDPKNVTTEDLPLILNRLDIIEELAPDSMDDVNLAAFQEAYKDLQNMLNKIQQQQ